jgi:hypothetical protein
MEDKGYELNFGEGRFIHPEVVSPDIAVRIGVRDANLYRLQGQPTHVLLHTTESLCDLWHMRMGHLHHGALPTMTEVDGHWASRIQS